VEVAQSWEPQNLALTMALPLKCSVTLGPLEFCDLTAHLLGWVGKNVHCQFSDASRLHLGLCSTRILSRLLARHRKVCCFVPLTCVPSTCWVSIPFPEGPSTTLSQQDTQLTAGAALVSGRSADQVRLPLGRQHAVSQIL
jgi:hypothetical protein